MQEVSTSNDVKIDLKKTSIEKLEKLIGNQKWRQLFHSAKEMSLFLYQIGSGFNYYDDTREFFGLDYWRGCTRSLIKDKNFKGKFQAILPFLTEDIINNSNFKYGFGDVVEGGEIMFDAMPNPEIAELGDEKMEERDFADDGAVDDDMATTAAPTAPADAPMEDDEEKTGDASTEANNDLDVESEMIKENTVFFTSLGWASSKKISFKLPEDVSKFRVSVFAISKDGRYGTHTDFVSSQRKFDVNMNIPLYIYLTETLVLDVNLYNNNSENITITNNYNSETWSIDANSLKRESFYVLATDLPKTFKFTPSQGDAIDIVVNPMIKNGLSFERSRTYMVQSQNDVTVQVMPPAIELPSEKIPGSVLFKMTYSPLGSPVILSGYEKLIREPFGCFEQTSSTTFPMVILMQYLNMQKNQEDQDKIDEMKFKITTNLKKGVEKLLKFETSTGGFEWFGSSPGHVTLTAYGLWQFLEMNKLGNYVSLDVIDRTLNWLRGKYSTSDIEFTLSQGMDSFGNPPQEISDIYIVFVMSMFDQYNIDYSSVVNPIISKFESGSTTNDSYLLSFVGLLYENLDLKDKAMEIASRLIQNQDSLSGEFKSVETTITLSQGKSKSVETTAMAILFLLESDSSNYMEIIEKAVDYLMKNMNFGYFFSTQATVVALKALVKYSEFMTSVKTGTKNFEVNIESVVKDYEVEVSDDTNKEYPSITFEEFKDTTLTNINVSISPKFTLEEKSKYMFSLDYSYSTTSPISVQDSVLSVELTSNLLSNAESFNLKVGNKSSEKQGMVNLIFYKPSNLKVNLNDLETLRKSNKIDYYELLTDNSEIVFYWRGIGPNETYEIDLTLAQEFEISQRFTAKASAYLYYDKDGSVVFA